MPTDPTRHAIKAVTRFAPLSRKLPPKVDSRQPKYMFKLVTDDTAYAKYKKAPEVQLRAHGIDPDKVDVPMFTELARQLRRRREGKTSVIGRAAEEMAQKQTNEASEYKFDSSGFNTEKQTESRFGRTQSFEGRSPIRDWRERVLRHELNLLFFPAQPLVTPALLAKIRKELAKGKP